ncbi:peptidoglycan DD-metalloendopeptidase family protein [Actinoplanes sp. NPDC048791]|uniref:peptidoglycan DD-metalloendopeptidase family protein n=1 Tax=Actinoplanes sp. NPDC048791 TaxID=3154623 RepID=UPI0033C719A0
MPTISRRPATVARAAATVAALAASMLAAVASPALADNAHMNWPTSGPITGIVGDKRTGHSHQGVDIGAPTGSPVYATYDGKVTNAFKDSCGGQTIYIAHAYGYQSRYLHLSSFSVGVGQQVSQGQKIAVSGNTGTCTTGAHLHFEIRQNGSSVSFAPATARNSRVSAGAAISYAFAGLGSGGPAAAPPDVAIARTAAGQGYWLAAADGGVFSYGDAQFYGSMGGKPLAAPVVGIAATPSGKGYWLVAKDGGIFAFGDAQFYGSMGGKPLNAPMVGITPTATGRGYWTVARDGGIFAFGDAQFYGSMGGKPLNAPVVGLAATPSGKGYWLVAADGGIFAFGDAPFYGSMGGKPLNAPMVGIASTTTGAGYWMVARDGGVFTFGDATFFGGGQD